MSEKIEVGSIVEGKVVRTKPFGVIVALPDNSQGLVHISHISTSFVQNVTDHINIGDVVRVKVLSVDAASGKISLSIKEAAEPVKKPRSEWNASGGDFRPKAQPVDAVGTFEDKLKEWIKVSNERQAGLNKRNKRR